MESEKTDYTGATMVVMGNMGWLLIISSAKVAM